MSVLLDTNVVSELIHKAPDLAVEAWAVNHTLEKLFFAAVGEAELRYGAAILPAGPTLKTPACHRIRASQVSRYTAT